jgi:hypothetical protein
MLEQIIHGGEFELTNWKMWRAVLLERLSEMWLPRETVNGISERYYDHHPLLFADLDSWLNLQTRTLEDLTKHCNSVQRKFTNLGKINSKSLLSSIRKQALTGIEERVAIAKSKTLEEFGEAGQLGD